MKGLIICGIGPCVPDTTSDCPDRDKHTPCPTGYLSWHDWASAMSRAGSKQRRCPTCKGFRIWTPPVRKLADPWEA